MIELYKEYSKKIDRFDLYKNVANFFDIKKALYPGSYIDITPSLYIENVLYIDNYKHTSKFFNDKKSIFYYIDNHKIYDNSSEVNFLFADYISDNLDIDYDFDLIISQYAGFVSFYTKKYLKVGGIILCNDSHWDATLNYLDDSLEFIAVLENDNLLFNNLSSYFKRSKNKSIDIEEVKRKMKPPRYIINAENYLFRKLY